MERRSGDEKKRRGDGKAVLVRGQRIFLRGRPAVVIDAASGQATVELDDGRTEIVSERELVTAESAESAQQREGPR